MEVEPIAFTHMWDTLAVGAQFSCRIVQLSDNMKETTDLKPQSMQRTSVRFQLDVFCQHLKEQGFVVVAAGTHADGFTKVYVLGASRTHPALAEVNPKATLEPISSSIYFLSEIKICTADDRSEAYVVDSYGNGHIFVMDCVAKCTSDEYLPIFIAEFKFGSIYRLL